MSRSLILALIVALASPAAALAAELPSRRAAPPSSAHKCDHYGAGFIYVPASDTCIKVGGRVEVETHATGDIGAQRR